MLLRRCPTASSCAGLSLVEMLVVVTILTVSVGMLSGTLANVGRLGPAHRESARALEAARNAVESMRAVPFEEIYATFNDAPDDDPGGVGTAPGAGFEIEGLDAAPGDADGLEGRIVFPEIGGELREDLVAPDLGMPRDLDGDGVRDGLDHATDYALLPVCVRIEWSGRGGPRTFEQYTTLARP